MSLPLTQYNFYQSQPWREILKKVYLRKTFEVSLLGQNYQGIIKEKNIRNITFKRYQVQGVVSGESLEHSIDFKEALKDLRRQFYGSWTDMFFQIGLVDRISSFDTKQVKFPEFCKQIHDLREQNEAFIKRRLGVKKSFRENMPVSTVITYLGQSDSQFLEQMGQGCRQQIKKAKSKKLTFHIASDADRDEFYDVWQGVGSNKGFNVVPRAEYDRLRHYLSTNKGSLFYNAGNLFVAKSEEGKIVSGSIVIYDQDTLFYLYGGTDREFGNVGGHQYLMYQIMLWARDYGFSYFDLGGGAPTGYPHHPLANVSKFKEALGGTKVEYYGNFDLVFNPWLYRLFQWQRGGH